jgi:hypothetical protein
MPLSEVMEWDLEDIDCALGLLDMKSDNDRAVNEYMIKDMKGK